MDQTISLSLFIPPVNIDTASVLHAFFEETCLMVMVSKREVRPGVYVNCCPISGDNIIILIFFA